MPVKRREKIKSTTLWFSIWSASVITYIVIFKIDNSWVGSLLSFLSGIIISYTIGNKAINFRHGPEEKEDNGK